MKIQLIISLILLIVFASCDSSLKGSKETKNKKSDDPKIELGTFSSDIDLEECHCDSLLQDSLKTFFKNDEPYTGRCYDNYPSSDKRYMEMSFLEGKIHGFFTVYDKNGGVLTRDRYHKGEKIEQSIDKNSNQNTVYCKCDSLKEEKLTFGNKTIKKYKDLPFSGVCYDYYPNSDKKYLEVNYLEGFVDGKMIIYDKSGEIIAIEQYKKGEKID